MSLTDLKRKPHPLAPAKLSVDEFIEDANNYSAGKPSLLLTKQVDMRPSSKFRHATFTLHEQSIQQLDALAKANTLAKSKLLRLLIQHASDLPPAQLAAILTQLEESQ